MVPAVRGRESRGVAVRGRERKLRPRKRRKFPYHQRSSASIRGSVFRFPVDGSGQDARATVARGSCSPPYMPSQAGWFPMEAWRLPTAATGRTARRGGPWCERTSMKSTSESPSHPERTGRLSAGSAGPGVNRTRQRIFVGIDNGLVIGSCYSNRICAGRWAWEW
jgi:hypothetical protein